jgi:NOL1/NOP2/fmu family ribosome biogenesis protein
VFNEFSIIKKWENLEIRTKEAQSFSALPNIQNMWIPFWELRNSLFTFDFFSGQTFWKHASKNIIELTLQQSKIFIQWWDMEIESSQIKNVLLWQVIITHDNLVLGVSLLQKNNKLKNQVPRENIKI